MFAAPLASAPGGAPGGGQLHSASSAGQQLSAAARNAEALFEAKNVAEIRQIEARTRQDIDEKNVQLRQLVGDSYRDLIDGTDKIIDISTKCHGILGNVLAIQEAFASLAVSVSATTGSTQDGKEHVRKHRELHAVGSRVKYVMDTPEVIWGALDAQEHLEAARRLLRVQEVHAQLHAAFAGLVATKFPVLAHQWQTVLKFRQNILASALNLLSTQPDLSSQAAADALAAVALLQGQDTAAALQAFLAARKQWVQQQLEQAAASPAGGQQAAGAVLTQLAQSVQSCVAQVGELFTAQRAPGSSNGDGDGSLLQQAAQEDESDASELFFGSTAAEGSNSPEAAQWRQQAAAFYEQLAPLQREQVQEATSAWLSEIAGSCSRHGLQLLQQCADADSLLEAQLAVHTAMAEWTAPSSDDAAAEDAESRGEQTQSAAAAAASRLSRVASLAAGGSPGGSPIVRGRAAAAAVVSDWVLTCQAVLGQSLDLWQVLFHAPFLERCKQLIASALGQACSSVQEPLRAALEQAARHEPEPAGQLRPGLWPAIADGATGPDAAAAGGLVGADSSASLTVGGSIGRSLSLHPSGPLREEGREAGFRNEVVSIQRLFDQQLHAALQAVLLLTAAEQQPGQNSSKAGAFGPSRSTSLQPTSSTASSMLLRGGSLHQPGSPATPSGVAAAAAGSAASSAAAAAAAAAGKQRGSELEAFAQQECVRLTEQLAGRLQQQLQSLPAAPPAGPAGAADVEQVLLLARLCTSLAAASCMLPAFLGPPGAWPAAVKAGPHADGGSQSGGAGGGLGSSLPASLAQGVGSLGPAAAALLRLHHPGLAAAAAPNSQAAAAATQLAVLQQQLHAVACSGYAQWAAWVGASLAAELAAAIAADELLHSDATPLSWGEVRLVAAAGAADGSEGLLDLLDDEGAAAAAGDMSFALPACPSAAVMQLLSRAAWEVRRAGEHLITTEALQLLLWEVHGASLALLQQLLASGGGAATAASNGHSAPAADGAAAGLSEKGVLQLLFDQRFVRDVLGGGKPVSTVAAAGAAAVAKDAAARKALVLAVEQQLQDLLDPIDWATYEPHLWDHVQRYYGRTAMLLGTLAQLSRPYGDAAAAALRPSVPGAESNALNVLPVVPRFHYLPISTPSAASLPGRQRSIAAAAALSGAASGLQQQQALPLQLAGVGAQASDLAAQFLISDVGSAGGGGREGLAASPAPPAAGGPASFPSAAADSAAATGASALSALQAKLQGSSFTAFGSMLGGEVTAMAQNFGDGLGGLSQSAVGGLLSSFARREGSATTAAAAAQSPTKRHQGGGWGTG